MPKKQNYLFEQVIRRFQEMRAGYHPSKHELVPFEWELIIALNDICEKQEIMLKMQNPFG